MFGRWTVFTHELSVLFREVHRFQRLNKNIWQLPDKSLSPHKRGEHVLKWNWTVNEDIVGVCKEFEIELSFNFRYINYDPNQ